MSRDDLRVLELINMINLAKDKIDYCEEIRDFKQVKSLKDQIKKFEKELSKLQKDKDV